MEIKQLFIPASNTKTRPGIKLTPKYITVHETDNTAAGANAAAHAKLQFNGNSRTASWHFTVDDREIWQSIPEDEVAWHAGDGGNGTGNRQSLAVEICVNSDGDFEKAKQNAAWLVRQLMDKHGIPITNVVQHNHWSGKDCPHTIRHTSGAWDDFLKMLQVEDKGTALTKANGLTRILKLTSPMMKGDDVKRLQQRLQIKADGIFGPLTEQAVRNWQRFHDEHGNVVQAGKGLKIDGIVGPKTWGALFR